MNKNLLFLLPYPHSTAPSQRFRFEQYFVHLEKHGAKIKTQSFIDQATWKILYSRGKTTQKVWGIVKGFLRRLSIFLTLYKYDYIFIHREASPIGPPVFEWLIAKVFRKKIIYDYDDAIWIPNTSEQNKIAEGIKWHSKVASICKWSYKVSAGNAYLADYARQYNQNVVITPTTIDTENVHNLIKDHDAVTASPFFKSSLRAPSRSNLPEVPHSPVIASPSAKQSLVSPQPRNDGVKTIIGWTGSHSTLQYINDIIPVLQKLEKEYPIEFQVISNKDPQLPLRNFMFVPWKKETEIEDLVKFDIGLMPLTDDKWAKGKCGFKALQYMALCIPPLVSPVGVNTEIVQHGVNGFICTTQEDWLKHLQQLLENPELRKTLGKEARKTVEEKYSVKSNTQNFLGLFS